MAVHDWTRVDAGIFHDFHHEWISTIKRSLNSGLLPADYYALAEQIAGGLGPDVLTLENAQPKSSQISGNGGGKGGGGIALATSPPKVQFMASAAIEQFARRRKRIAIRHVSDDSVVAIIEIVSPGNKSTRHALRAFVDKAIELLDAGVHLLVIDLFPPGPRDPQGIHAAIWSEMTGEEFQLPANLPLTLVSYAAGDLKRAFIEPTAVRRTLPDMPLFLEPDIYVLVPLETTYAAAFEAVPKRWRDELA